MVFGGRGQFGWCSCRGLTNVPWAGGEGARPPCWPLSLPIRAPVACFSPAPHGILPNAIEEAARPSVTAATSAALVERYGSRTMDASPFARCTNCGATLWKANGDARLVDTRTENIMDRQIVVSYGGGVNSTAMLCGMIEKNIRPALILFADTGCEHDETLDYVDGFSGWLQKVGFPPVTTVRYESCNETLEAECLVNETLPSLAFGFKGCSVKWKRQPMDKFNKSWTDKPVTRAIGIHAGEAHRGRIDDTDLFHFWYPLIEWNYWQRDCEAIIARNGHPIPRKSSCWCCPAKTKNEVRKQAADRPDLHARCVEMERNARDAGGLKQVKGLGRHWSWEAIAAADAAQLKLLPDTAYDSPCGCWDGECLPRQP